MDNVDQDALLTKLREEFLPKLPAIEGTWWQRYMRTTSLVKAQRAITTLIHLVSSQEDRIGKLESEIADLKERIAYLNR